MIGNRSLSIHLFAYVSIVEGNRWKKPQETRPFWWWKWILMTLSESFICGLSFDNVMQGINVLVHDLNPKVSSPCAELFAGWKDIWLCFLGCSEVTSEFCHLSSNANKLFSCELVIHSCVKKVFKWISHAKLDGFVCRRQRLPIFDHFGGEKAEVRFLTSLINLFCHVYMERWKSREVRVFGYSYEKMLRKVYKAVADCVLDF